MSSDLDKLREQIAAYQHDLVIARDRDLDHAQKVPSMAKWFEGHAAGIAIALTFLRTWTDGEFGMSLAVQRAEQKPGGDS